ncbi:MAG: ADOP family duplicated permease [Acidobacteria bacterium]|nr:ADOP family duplicated permease [Acidobacteriota bacterium]
MRRLLLKMFRRRRMAEEIEAELAFHREMAEAAGNPIPLGNTSVIKEKAFDLWRFQFLENVGRDLVYALRGLRKSPGFVGTALLSLALGIGVNTTMFSLAVEFLLSEPSVREAGSLVYIKKDGSSHAELKVVEQLRRSGVFEEVAGETEMAFINFNDGVETRRIFADLGTKNYFTVVGVSVAQGRGWNESDGNDVAVIHPAFWRSRLGADPAIVGKAIWLDGRPYTVLGILPDNFRSLMGYGYAPDVMVPSFSEGMSFRIFARRKAGMGFGEMNAALPALRERMASEFPSEEERERGLRATPVSGVAKLQVEREAMTVALFFGILLVLVGLVLLIACVNVAGLLLARASVRRQEIAIRLALGASRGRLLQQLLAESLLLSLAGAGLGFGLALVAARAAAAIPLPLPFPIRLQVEPDCRVATYAAVLAIVATVASGLLPAWQSVRESLTAGMHRERKLRLRRTLVVAQIAVSFVVLTTAALFLKNLVMASEVGVGFDVKQTVRAEVNLPPAVYKDSRAVNGYVERALGALRAVPGVTGAAAARIIPFTDSTNYGNELTMVDTGEKVPSQFNWNAVTPGFFGVMEIPVVRGREFVAQDNGGARVVVVNEEFVRRYLGKREAVGTAFRWKKDGVPYQIVGVVKGTKNNTIGEEAKAQMYEPTAQRTDDETRVQLVTRSAVRPGGMLGAVRTALRGVEPGAGLEVQTMFQAIGFAFLPSQVGAALMGSIGALGLLLAVIGLYGVLAYSVMRRTREIGIRMAIGASPWDVTRLVLREFGGLVVAGMGIGLVVTVLVTRPLAMFFVAGLSGTDAGSLGTVVAVLGVTGLLAAVGPVRRALRVDPVECLRCE